MAERTRDPEPQPSRTAKLFMNGRSQAVRLPVEYRFSGTEVQIRREGDAVILEPIRRKGWPEGFWARLARLREGLDIESLERPLDMPPAPLDFEVDEP